METKKKAEVHRHSHIRKRRLKTTGVNDPRGTTQQVLMTARGVAASGRAGTRGGEEGSHVLHTYRRHGSGEGEGKRKRRKGEKNRERGGCKIKDKRKRKRDGKRGQKRKKKI